MLEIPINEIPINKQGIFVVWIVKMGVITFKTRLILKTE